MIIALLGVLVVLFVMGYVHIPYFSIGDMNLFTLFGHQITLLNLLVFGLVIWLIDLLPDPFRTIASILLLLWLLSLFGFVAISGFSNLILLALIIGVVLYIIKSR